jgi:hypothetical protein
LSRPQPDAETASPNPAISATSRQILKSDFMKNEPPGIR